jgi:hypothetical protein
MKKVIILIFLFLLYSSLKAQRRTPSSLYYINDTSNVIAGFYVDQPATIAVMNALVKPKFKLTNSQKFKLAGAINNFLRRKTIIGPVLTMKVAEYEVRRQQFFKGLTDQLGDFLFEFQVEWFKDAKPRIEDVKNPLHQLFY